MLPSATARCRTGRAGSPAGRRWGSSRCKRHFLPRRAAVVISRMSMFEAVIRVALLALDRNQLLLLTTWFRTLVGIDLGFVRSNADAVLVHVLANDDVDQLGLCHRYGRIAQRTNRHLNILKTIKGLKNFRWFWMTNFINSKLTFLYNAWQSCCLYP